MTARRAIYAPAINETRPRQYAQAICALRTTEERIAALDAVPLHLRGWVQRLVELAYTQQRAAIGRKQKRRRL